MANSENPKREYLRPQKLTPEVIKRLSAMPVLIRADTETSIPPDLDDIMWEEDADVWEDGEPTIDSDDDGDETDDWDRNDDWNEPVDDESYSTRLPSPTLLDLKFDFRDVDNATFGLLDLGRGSLRGLVANNYAAFDGMLCQGDPEPEPASDESCVSCRLVLIWGASLVPKEGGGEKITNPPIHAAHNAAANFYNAWQRAGKGCLHVLHRNWKSGFGEEEDGHAYQYAGGKWKKFRDASAVTKLLKTDSKGREIDYYSDVLVIYHGENAFRSVQVLKWLGKNMPAPICNLYLWSCYGAAKIHPTKPAVSQIKDGLKQVVGIKAKIRRKLDALKKEMLKYPKSTNVDKWKQAAGRLQRRLECGCRLCVYTAPYLDEAKAAKLIKGELGNLKGKKKAKAESALRKLEKAVKAGEKFAVALGINPDTGEMVLRSPGKEMLRFCFDEQKKTWTEPKTQSGITEVMPGLVVEDYPYEVRKIVGNVLKQKPV